MVTAALPDISARCLGQILSEANMPDKAAAMFLTFYYMFMRWS